jgi:catechol 2,3-dioxygenase-like lactoylglutathione lyase family enzyme
MNEPKKKIDHMVFNVRNLEEAVRFYTEVVGMKVVMRFDDRKMAFLSFGDRLGDIRLFETGATADPDRQTHGFNHVAFEPDGGLPALEQLHHRLIDKGAQIERLEEHASGRHKSIYFFDPDGNRLEFYWENPTWRAESAEMVKAAFGQDKHQDKQS